GAGVTAPGPSRPPGSAAPTAAPTVSPTPLVSMPPVDEARMPRSPAQARALLGRVIADSSLIGPGVVPATPYESDPSAAPYLDGKCVWQTGPLPADVLATRTRYFHVPAREGRGRIQINATVTVHHSREESGWEVARAMEEVMRCPDQQLRGDQRLKGLLGTTLYYGEYTNNWTEDAFNEYGEYYGTEEGGPHLYYWYQGQYGPLVMAVSAKGAQGVTKEELSPLLTQGMAWMMQRAKNELGKAG
ncbi:hypothetical protein ACM614_04315, partial [Streptomyces sp. 12297]